MSDKTKTIDRKALLEALKKKYERAVVGWTTGEGMTPAQAAKSIKDDCPKAGQDGQR